MKHLAAIMVSLLLCPMLAFAQTKDETIAYITSEFRSFESRDYVFKDLNFSSSGETFTLRRAASKEKDKLLYIELKNVDIYKVTNHHANGVNWHYLVVRSRGRDGYFSNGGSTYHGAVTITPTIDNEKKIDALERAFTRLIALATGRKFPFTTPSPAP